MLKTMIRTILTLCWAASWFISPPPVAAQEPANHGTRNGPQPNADDSQIAKSPSEKQEFGVKKTANLRFCSDSTDQSRSACICDVFLPQIKTEESGDKSARWPVVLCVHGGGWLSGDKWTMNRHAHELAQKGIAAVSMNYRLAPQSKFPAQVDDVREALIWIVQNADEYSLDTDNIGLFGYSAGGHLVSLVATLEDEPWETVLTTTNWKKEDKRWTKIPTIRAVCAGGPPTDFRDLPLDSTLMAYFLGGSRREQPETYAAASPVCFVSSDDPPFQIIHGEADELVPIANGQAFHRTLLDANVNASMKTIPGRGHFLAFISPKLTTWMLDFFEHHLSDQADRTVE